MMRRDMMRPAMRMPWKLFFAGSKFSAIFACRGRHLVAGGGIGVDAEFPQCGERLAS